METVAFFTPVHFQEKPFSLLGMVDNYFYFGGKKACVIKNVQEAILVEGSTTRLVTALKIISYCTVVLPLIMLLAKAILRSIYTFRIVNMPQNIVEQINTLLPNIQAKEKDNAIHWHPSGEENLIFSLTDEPKWIFKIKSQTAAAEQTNENRFANMERAREVCKEHNLNLLIVPKAEKFTVGGITIIAEERMDIGQNMEAEKENYRLGGLDETVRQLAVFIAKTGFSDVAWRNIPLLDRDSQFEGNRRVALIDLEEMGGALIGLFTGPTQRPGLIGCVHTEAQVDVVLEEAKKYDIAIPEGAKANRMAAIERCNQLQAFHQKNGIVGNPKKPIQVDDLAFLGLDLEETAEREGKIFTLGQGVAEVITNINEAIDKEGKRDIRLIIEETNLTNYDQLGRPNHGNILSEEEKQKIWLRRIIHALIDKGHLFALDKVTGMGYFIQA
jgi:hypothetical protein